MHAATALCLALTVHAAFARASPSRPSAPGWTPMPLLSAQARAAGIFPGGEGGQWPRGPVAVSPADPRFLLLPIDVGGVYRSLDGGARWQIAMVGWSARGANAFAMDPRNPKRAIGVAGNSMDWGANWGASPHGLYLTGDRAASWRHVLAIRSGIGGAVAYDATSFDRARGHCLRAYFLAPHEGLYETGDGGRTWARLGDGPVPGITDRDWTQGGAIVSSLAVDARTGALYAGGAGGLHRSADRGRTWARVRDGDVCGLSVTAQGAVFVSGTEGVAASTDGGRTWRSLPCAGLDRLGGKPVQHIAVSPVDPRRMLCWVAGDNWNWPRYVSSDGGATWRKVVTERGHAPLPMNARHGYPAWSPVDADVAYSLGGDWPTKSTDGGRTFRWCGNGFGGVMAGGKLAFSTHHPNTVFVGFQDYNGAATHDGGRTWTWFDVSGKGWGGHDYGAFALSPSVMWVGDSEGWSGARRLRITRDGGKTWAFVTDAAGTALEYGPHDAAFGDPRDPNVGFAGRLRTADGGHTWRAMDACDAVLTADPASGALWGAKGALAVRSADHGISWVTVAAAAGPIDDLAYDHRAGRLYVACRDGLAAWQDGTWAAVEVPRDQFGNSRVQGVAVDPAAPNVLYVCGPRNIYASHATVCRSTDSGRTWRNLTVTAPLRGRRDGGPNEVCAIRVHPVTRELWAMGQCFGMWRHAPPGPGERGVSAAEASAPRHPSGAPGQRTGGRAGRPRHVANGHFSAGWGTPLQAHLGTSPSR